jgi:outer membrane protein assembly factor BamB
MPESNHDATIEAPGHVPAEAVGTQTTPVHPKPTLRLAWISLGVAALLTAISQYFAPQFDHQNANLIGLTCIALASLYFLFCLHRIDRWGGHRWRIPVAALACLVALIIGFRFDGFSGEMFPQFRFRWATETRRQLKSVSETPTEGPVLRGVSETQVAIDAPSSSPQFLGPNRNGVYDSRRFQIPQDGSEIKVLWDQGIGPGWSSFAVADGLAITLEQRDDQECLTCYRLADGEMIWIQKHSGRHENALGGIGPRSTPTIEGENVYATTATGHLWCVRRSSGEVVWSVDLLDLAGWDQATFEAAAPWGYAASPLLVDGLCVVSLGGPADATTSASLVALDAKTGSVVWKAGGDQLSYASPMLLTLAGVRQIVSVNEKTVSGHQIADGKPLWSFDWPGSTNTGANCASPVAVGDDQVLVGKGYGGGSALVQITNNADAWETRDVWRSNRVLKTKFNHTCVRGNVGYGIDNGALQAVNLDDATPYWTQPRRSRAAQGQAVLVEDVLIVQDEKGDIVLIEATTEEYHERLRISALDSKTWNIPTLAGRYLLVRNDRQAICFELPQKQSLSP